MKKLEFILTILFSISLTLYLFDIPGFSLFGVAQMGILSLIYFWFGIIIFNKISFRKMFKKTSYKDISWNKLIGTFATGIGLSFTILGILFKFMFWPGANAILTNGLTILGVVLMISIVKFGSNKSHFYKLIFYRILVFGGIGFSLSLISSMTIVEIKYRDSPKLINAYKKAFENPEDEKLWDEVNQIKDERIEKKYNGI